jgi:4-hydroxybenzoate polyprenyltransferase
MTSVRALRVLHPFPSVLDGAATAAIAMVADGRPAVAVRLGLAMILIQFAIGAVNDAVDAPFDRGRPDKPIVAGLVSPRLVRLVAGACAALGLLLAAASGPAALVLAGVGLCLGLAYDLGLKRTALAWLPFAAAIPLLVVFAWVGASGTIHPPVLLLLPVAALAGTALSLANALVDPEADRRVGMVTPVLRIGRRTSWSVAVVLATAAVGLAMATLIALAAPAPAVFASAGAGLVVLAGAWSTHDRRRDRRERAWEVEAVGMALLGVAWLAGVTLRG